MGKSFQKSLDSLDVVYEKAVNSGTKVISSFLRKYHGKMLLLVGSGGSFSAAVAFEYLCTKVGWKAKSITPLELNQYKSQIAQCAVILFTASGRNSDSKNAYNYVSMLEPAAILTICMRLDSPIKKMQNSNLHNYYFEYDMPVFKDGYLAVESLMSTIVLSLKAIEKVVNNKFLRLIKTDFKRQYFIDEEKFKNVLNKDTIIVLHGSMTTPAAIDMESKFSEVALGNIQLVDFRNFAHGRHYWISARGESTSIIALIDEADAIIADKTLSLLPDYIPVQKEYFENISANDFIRTYYSVFEMVNLAGKQKGVDPGRPKVEEYGKKMYHLNYNISNAKWCKELKKSLVMTAIYRKIGIYNEDEHYEYKQSCQYCLNKLQGKEYRGIVFDYDATIHDKSKISETEIEIFKKINYFLSQGIKIGIATGRGKSVRTELQKMIEKDYWEEVIIGYYNCGCFGMLSDESQPNKNAFDVPEQLLEAYRLLSEVNEVQLEGKDSENPYQLTVINGSNISDDRFAALIVERLSGIKQIKIMASSHSIDIIPESTSKNNIFEHKEFNQYKKNDYLIIGDSGHLGGNDYELLNSKNALSVDAVSSSMFHCWNFAPLGLRNLEATYYYLDHVQILEDKKRFTIGGM